MEQVDLNFSFMNLTFPFCLKRLARYLQQPSPTSRQAVGLSTSSNFDGHSWWMSLVCEAWNVPPHIFGAFKPSDILRLVELVNLVSVGFG